MNTVLGTSRQDAIGSGLAGAGDALAHAPGEAHRSALGFAFTRGDSFWRRTVMATTKPTGVSIRTCGRGPN